MNRFAARGSSLLRYNLNNILNNPRKKMVTLEQVVENNKRSQEIIDYLKTEVNIFKRLMEKPKVGL